jgi:hypothetical protein
VVVEDPEPNDMLLLLLLRGGGDHHLALLAASTAAALDASGATRLLLGRLQLRRLHSR